MRKVLLFITCCIISIAGLGQNTTVPEKTFAEKLSGIQTANSGIASQGDQSGIDASGDMSLTVPLVEVRSKTMSFPVQLNYSAGITVDQQSGPVGLGWGLPFGSIVRDYGAFEPDYNTSGKEINMVNDNGIDGRITFNNVDVNPSNHHKSLKYDISIGDFGGGIPDKYHISVPGSLSNTFWNQSSTGTLDWTTKNQVPWKISHTVKNFKIHQEFSRINEANLGGSNLTDLTDKSKFDKGHSFAAGIGLLPYVENGYLWDPLAASQGNFDPDGDEKYVKYDDFESFTITDDNGTQYVFGRPLRGQKYMFSEDPFWSTSMNASNVNVSDVSLGNFWKIDYIAEWLLTEIRSVDYVDVNNNGIADEGDTGDWIRIEYTTPVKTEFNHLLGAGNVSVPEAVPTYREWSNFSQTDRASSLMRERAYVSKIITPIQEVDFTISQRMEVDFDYYSKPANRVSNEFFYEDRKFSPSGSSSDFDIVYPVETMKYDSIKVIDRTRDRQVYPNEDPIQSIIVLNYAAKGSAEELAVSNYLIRDNTNVDRELDDPSISSTLDIGKYYTPNGRGKTTLLGVDFFTSELDPDDVQSYEFEYANNPSYSEIHKRSIVRKKFFPSLRQSAWSSSTVFDRAEFVEVDYFTEDDPNTILSVLPHDFLIDVPYEEKYYKINPLTATESDLLFHLKNLDVLAFDFSSLDHNVESISHDLYSVKDEIGYFKSPNTNADEKAAWSLTKIKYPTQGEVRFEYENDESDLSAEECLPTLSKYNELAKNRSLIQSMANLYIKLAYPHSANTVAPRIDDKTLTATFDISFDNSSGGIRLKSKQIDDGINEVVEVNYSYGNGHYVDLPNGYIHSLISGFNSFHSREKQRHDWEKDHYNILYNTLASNGFKNDYDAKMKFFALSEVFHASNSRPKHFYDFVEENYSDGSKIVRYYNTVDNVDKINLGNDPVYLNSPNIEFGTIKNSSEIGRSKFSIIEYDNGENNIYAYKKESFESSNSTPFEVSEFVQSTISFGSSVLNTSSFPSNTSDGNLTGFFSTYLKVMPHVSLFYQGLDPLRWSNNIFATGTIDPNNLRVGVGSTVMLDGHPDYYSGAVWSTPISSGNPPAFVNLVRFDGGSVPPDTPEEIGYTYQLQIPSENVNLWHKYRQQIIKETQTYKGIETQTEYTYDSNNGYLLETSVSSDQSNENIITKYEYINDIYGASTNKFSDLNLLRPVVGKTTYLQSVNDANALSASFTTWDYSLTIPKPKHLYYFKTDNTDNLTGKFTLTPFTISGTNATEWILAESDVIDYNEDNTPILSRINRLNSLNVLGYSKSISKATISYTEGLFDGTYTGFEDLNKPEDIPIGSKNIKEYWYYDDLETVQIIENADFGISSITPCSNSILLSDPIVDDKYIFLKIPNSQNNGQTQFEVGDNITVNGNYLSSGSPMPSFTANILSISMSGSYTRFCFDLALPSVYRTNWNNIDNSTVTISGNKEVVDAKTTSTYKRTGKYSYQLTPLSGDEPGTITPIRPVHIEKVSGIEQNCNDPISIPGSNLNYPENCYHYYQASVWLKHDYDIPRTQREIDNVHLPYTSGNNGGFVTKPASLTSSDFANTYYRGEVTTNNAEASKNVKIIYKIWDADRTNLIASGFYYVLNLDNNWRQYTIDIPILKSLSDKQLDVFVENNIVDNTSQIKKRSVFVDDFLVYPKGAKYSYSSIDKFGNPTHLVDNNDVYQYNVYDSRGRPVKYFDGYGHQLNEIEYHVTNNLDLKDNTMTERVWIDFNKSHQSRLYSDGFGKTKQSIIVDQEKNALLISKSYDYDNQGRVVRQHKAYPKSGTFLPEKHFTNYAQKASDFYQSNHAFSEIEYEQRPGTTPSKLYQPKLDTETDFITLRSDDVNTNTVGGVYGIPTYQPNELIVYKTISAEGNIAKSYVNKLGQVVLEEAEIGTSHTQNADGTLSSTGNASIAQTYFKYDKLGRIIKTIDPDGKATEYFYNSLGQLVKTITPDRGQSLVKYDKYNQIRFTQYKNDLAKANLPGNIDQFKYIKYDKWGRAIESGLMKEMPNQPVTSSNGTSYTPQVIFNNQTFIDDQDYPSTTDLFNELHHAYQYGESRFDFNSNAVVKHTVYSSHDLNDYHYVPATTDENTFTYNLDGTVKDISYVMTGLSGIHKVAFQYNRIGLPVSKSYTHPTNSHLNYKWETAYDNFGRPVQESSGNLNDFEPVSTHDYDLLGNVRSTGLGISSNPTNPYVDKIISKVNIRNQQVSQMSNNFRYGLTYNKNGSITDQYWSSEAFASDITTGTSVNINHYHYYYDKMNRLTGADYRTQTHNQNPFEYFADINFTSLNNFRCGEMPYVSDDVKQEIIALETGGGTGTPIGSPNKIKRAIESLKFVEETFNNNPVNFAALETTQQDVYLEQLIDEAGEHGIDLKAYEELKARIDHDDTHLAALQATDAATETDWKITGNARIGSVETYGEIEPKKLKKTKALLSEMNYVYQYCEPNYQATAFGLLPDFPTNGTETNSTKYDVAVWYAKNGNITSLNRTNSASIKTIQTYHYANPLNNQLTSVDWQELTATPTITNTGYTYDVIGNLLTDDRNDVTNIEYGSFHDLPNAITNLAGTKKYRYSIDGIRTVKELSANDIEYYIDGIILNQNEEVKSYQTSAGYAVPNIDDEVDNYYTVKDWLGTVRLTMNESGTITSARDHYAYGKLMDGRAMGTDVEGERYQFTGHEFDGETNYGYHGARYYNRELGRYMSIDPLAVKYPNWSDYHYTMCNPINYTDPTGMAVEGDYYDRQGRYLGTDGIDDNKVYVLNKDKRAKLENDKVNWGGELADKHVKELQENSTKLDVTHTEFQTISAIVEHEAGTSDADESLWIAHTANNAAKQSGKSLYDKLMSGYSSAPKSKKVPLPTSENSVEANSARAGVLDVLSGGTDPTGGSTLWDGTDFLAWGLKSPYGGKPHAKFRQYNNVTISESIYNSYLEGALSKYSKGRVRYFGEYYTIPAPVFAEKANWSNSYFNYSTGYKRSFGIEATGAYGHSIFWKKVKSNEE